MINEKTWLGSRTEVSALPLVSIVIPAYNHERYVVQSLSSAINQTYPNIELIIIDDGSTDGTADLIENTLKKNSHNRDVTFVRQTNQGLSKTLNKAIMIAKGEFVQFLASDDAYLPDRTSRCVEALANASESVAAIYSDGYLINEKDEKIMRFSDKYVRPLSSSTYMELLIGNWIPALGVLYRKSAIKRVGGFDESLAVEDYDLLLRLAKIYEIKSLPDKNFLYRWHSTNTSNNKKLIADQFIILKRKHTNLGSFWDFKSAIKSRSTLSALRNFSINNLDLLLRSVIRNIQTKHSIQNVSYLKFFLLLTKKAYISANARLKAIATRLRGIQIGHGSKVYGKIQTTGNNNNITIGKRAVILGDIKVITRYSYSKEQIYVGDDVVLDNNCILFSLGGQIRIGNGCFIGSNVIIQANGDVNIGNTTMIAANSSIYSNNHITELNGTAFINQGNRFSGVTIGNNCWIGTEVCVLDGASIGDNTVVGANCVVKSVHNGDSLVMANGVKAQSVSIRKRSINE